MHPTDPIAVPGATTTRRRVLKTGAKLAYAAPVVATSLKLSHLNALADGACTCTGAGAVFDETPYGGGGPSCCTCEHCKSKRLQPDGTLGGVIYPQAYYRPETSLCADPSLGFPEWFPASYCAPICTPCGTVSR
jgi:hypothetical protein